MIRIWTCSLQGQFQAIWCTGRKMTSKSKTDSHTAKRTEMWNLGTFICHTYVTHTHIYNTKSYVVAYGAASKCYWSIWRHSVHLSHNSLYETKTAGHTAKRCGVWDSGRTVTHIIYIIYNWPCSAQCQFGVVWCACNCWMACNSKTVHGRAKQSELCESESLASHIWCNLTLQCSRPFGVIRCLVRRS